MSDARYDMEASSVKNGSIQLEHRSTMGDIDEVPTILDQKTTRRLLWKLDLFILPLISITYFLASVSRSDLGNAKIAGMDKELELSAQDYSNAATAFLVGYIIFQLPGTLLLKKIGAPLQFGGALILWGFLTAVTVAVTNKAQLFALRFLIGCAEAFIQGAVFYLSFWYEYNELATRGAIFFSTSTIAGAFNGLISYAISKNLDGQNGWLPWKWIFLVDGVIPCGFGLMVMALLPTSPAKARTWLLTEHERDVAVQRSKRAHNTSEARLELKKVPHVLLSWHMWLMIIIGCGGHFCLSSLSNFLPAIIQSFGYTSVRAQLFSVIVYACAFVGIIFWARVADMTGARGITLAASTVGGVVGYAILVAGTNDKLRFAATCLTAFSVYPNIVLTLSWCAMSFVGYTRRGSALAFYNIFSQVVAIAGNQAYSDPPYYRKGQSVSLAMTAMVLVLALALSWLFKYKNSLKDRMAPERADELRQMGLEAVGDNHPDFKYTF